MARGFPNQKVKTASDGSSSMDVFKNTLTTTFNTLAIPVPQTFEDVQQGGQILFENFVRQEFLNHGLAEPSMNHFYSDTADSLDSTSAQVNGASIYNEHSIYSHTPGYKTSDWTKIGRELREMADEIARSRQGENIRKKADSVCLQEITHDQFIELLVELFTGGFTKERVVLLFYFCTNLIVRAAQQNVSSLTRYLFSWSLSYILNKVCAWVYKNGGWEKVLSKMYDVVKKVGVIFALIVGIGCGIVYIRKNW